MRDANDTAVIATSHTDRAGNTNHQRTPTSISAGICAIETHTQHASAATSTADAATTLNHNTGRTPC